MAPAASTALPPRRIVHARNFVLADSKEADVAKRPVEQAREDIDGRLVDSKRL